MKILISGGAGFIGSALVRQLLQHTRADLVVVDSFTYAANPLSLSVLSAGSRLRIVRQDISEMAAMKTLFEAEAPDAVFHLAAESHVDRSITGSAPFIATNVTGVHAMLEAARAYWSRLKGEAREAFRFVHLSTDEVFGSLPETGAFSETSPYDPSSPYSASKAAGDHLVSAWTRTYGLPTIIVHCSNNYGPRQFPEKLIPLVILNLLEGGVAPVYGDGLNVRDWVHVEDHARALQTVLERGAPGERYVVGSRSEHRNIEIVQLIARRLDQASPNGAPHAARITYVEDRLGHDRRYAVDPSKIEAELGWRAEIPFESGLAGTIDWYLANRDWWAPLRMKRG